jgi:hypothetical protein
MVSKHQASQAVREIIDGRVTESTARTVTGIDLNGGVFVKAFPNQQVMDSWLASNSVAEITSVR